MWWLALAVAGAGEAQCEYVGMGRVTSIEAPAVIVLGERKGTQPDLHRADRIVERLAARAEVTLALHAVHRDAQPVLDEAAQGASLEGLDQRLEFSSHWGFSYAPYERLVSRVKDDRVAVVAVGLDREPRPDDEPVPLPPSYLHLLEDAMLQQPLPVELESRYVQMVAWHDHSVARRAVEAWDEEGYLVIVADRLHVEGGKGVGWQAQRLTEAKVHTFLLADGDAACYPGDAILR